jgi:hypothetical protein
MLAVKLALVGIAIYLGTRKSGPAVNSGSARCQVWPVVGKRWQICRGRDNPGATGVGPWVGFDIPWLAKYHLVFHQTTRRIMAAYDVSTYDAKDDSALIVATWGPGGQAAWLNPEVRAELDDAPLGA